MALSGIRAPAAVALLGGIALAGTTSAQHTLGADLCYKTKVQGATGSREFMLKPITGFPANHVLVDETVCGSTYAAGDPIPGGTQLWSTSGRESPTDSSCKNTTGGGQFYAYDYPNRASSNTGFEQDRAVVVYFVVDASGALSLVLVFDRPHNGNKGSVEMAIDAPDLIGRDIRFDLRDDTHEPSCPGGDMCQWDQTTAKLDRMRWDWVECCTDGMVMGNLPSSEGFQIPFSFGLLDGIDTFRMASWNADNATVAFEEIPVDEVLSSGLTVVAETCSDYCAAKTSCGECSLDDNCGWCEATGTCAEAGSHTAAACPAGLFNDGSQCCAVCTVATTFAECMPVPGCGWDHEHGMCISVAGTEGHADFRKCNTTDYVTKSCGTECSAAGPLPKLGDSGCPGDVRAADGSLEAWCSGHGACEWGSKQCECDAGYGGRGCEAQCPGTLLGGTPCSGHGKCSAVDGTCTCDCGYSGPDCAVEQCVEQCSEPPADLASVCVIWPNNCEKVCGRRVAPGDGDGPAIGCTGRESATVPGECECLPGWWGEDCTERCPGVAEDGTGEICGGHGVCDPDTGTCICEGCSSAELGTTGICYPTPAATCHNNGASFCPAEGGDHACACVGMWAGADCTECNCPGAAVCSSINGQCRYSTCGVGEYVRMHGSPLADTVCAPVTKCDTANGEYEAYGPTATSDRICALTTECGDDEWQVQPQTAVSDRVCANVTSCGPPGEVAFEIVRPTTTSDRRCERLTALCESESALHYEAVAPTATSDRSCALVAECHVSGHQYELAAPTYSTDRVCADYTPCNYASGMQYMAVLPTSTADLVCRNVTNCTMGTQYMTAPPTNITDRACAELTVCDADTEFEVNPPGTTQDRVCAALTQCSTNQYEQFAATMTSDRVCAALSSCTSVHQYERTAPTASSDRECAEMTRCDLNAGEYEATAPTATADRVCGSVTAACATGEAEVAPPSATSDRKCWPILQLVYPADYAVLAADGTEAETFGRKVAVAVGHHSIVVGLSSGSVVVAVAVPNGAAFADAEQRLNGCSDDLCIEHGGATICPHAVGSAGDCTLMIHEEMAEAAPAAEAASGAEATAEGGGTAIIGIVVGCCVAVLVAAYMYKRHQKGTPEGEHKVVPLERVTATGSLRHNQKVDSGVGRRVSQMSVRLSLTGADMELLFGSDASEDFSTRLSSTRKQASDLSVDNYDAVLEEEEPPAALAEPDFCQDIEVELALKSALAAAAAQLGVGGDAADKAIRLAPDAEGPVRDALAQTLSTLDLSTTEDAVATTAGLESLRGIVALADRDMVRDAVATGLVAAGYSDSAAFDEAEAAVDSVAGQQLRRAVTDAQLESTPGLGAAISAALAASMRTMNGMAAERERQRLALHARLAAKKQGSGGASESDINAGAAVGGGDDLVQAGIVRGVTELLANPAVATVKASPPGSPSGSRPASSHGSPNAVAPAPPSIEERADLGVEAAMRAAGRDLQRTTVQFDNRRKEQQRQLEQRRTEIAARKAQARLAKAKHDREAGYAASGQSSPVTPTTPNFRRAAWVAVASATTEKEVLKNAGVQAQRNQLQHENNRRAQQQQLQMRVQKMKADRLDRENSIESGISPLPISLPGLVHRPSMDAGQSRPAVRTRPPALPVLTSNGRPGFGLRPPPVAAEPKRPKSPGAVLSAGLAEWASSI